MSWPMIKLGDACTIIKGNIGIKKATPGEYPLVVLGEERKSHSLYQFDCEAVIVPLVSSTGHGHKSMKRIFFQSGKFSVGSILCAVIPRDTTQLLAEFLYIYLDSFKEKELVSRMKGMANVTLSMTEIASVPTPVPVYQMRRCIIDRYRLLNNIEIEISKQRDLLEDLRQTIFSEYISEG